MSAQVWRQAWRGCRSRGGPWMLRRFRFLVLGVRCAATIMLDNPRALVGGAFHVAVRMFTLAGHEAPTRPRSGWTPRREAHQGLVRASPVSPPRVPIEQSRRSRAVRLARSPGARGNVAPVRDGKDTARRTGIFDAARGPHIRLLKSTASPGAEYVEYRSGAGRIGVSGRVRHAAPLTSTFVARWDQGSSRAKGRTPVDDNAPCGN